MSAALVPTEITSGSSTRSSAPLVVAGAHRGARLMQPTISAFNRTSDRFVLVPTYVDPLPDRAAALARSAGEQGVEARAIEAHIEEVLGRAEARAPIVLSVDTARTIANVLRDVELDAHPVLIYFLVRMPNLQLLGLRATLQADDEPLRDLACEFFDRLSFVTTRSGASAILGGQGRAEHIAVEPLYRRWFADHMVQNLPRVVVGVQPENDPFEITLDGHTTMSLMLRRSAETWADPLEIATEMVREPQNPIHRGRDFGVAETGPDGIRLHTVRIRATDGRVAVRAAAVIDEREYVTAEQERLERARREAVEALRVAERQTLSRTRPVYTTD